MAFLGMANVYAMRVNLSVAIVAMVKKDPTKRSFSFISSLTDDPDTCSGNYTVDDGPEGDFDWDSKQQGLILGAFFYGYVVTQLPGGILAEKYGGKWLFGLGILVTAILTLLTPLAANAGIGWFIAVRVAEGLGEGVTYPALNAMISKWVPKNEKTTLGSFCYVGVQFGTVISLPISGILANEVSWESVFYVFGVMGVVWFIGWCFFISDSPSNHPRISEKERLYIESNIPSANEGKALPFPPLKAMAMSLPVYAVIIAHMGQNWGFYTLLTETPTYLDNVLKLPLKSNGFLSALPYLCQVITSIIFGRISDFLVNSGRLRTVVSRKLFQTIGQVGPALGLIWLAYVGCSKASAITALCLSAALNGAIYSGFQLNHIDLSPNYAGTLMGITNTFANICGFVTPYVTGAIINDKEDSQSAWRVVFFISSSVYIVFNVFFVVFGKAEVQWWNTYWSKEKKVDQ